MFDLYMYITYIYIYQAHSESTSATAGLLVRLYDMMLMPESE